MEWIIGFIIIYLLYVIDLGASSKKKASPVDNSKSSNKQPHIGSNRELPEPLPVGQPEFKQNNGLKPKTFLFDKQEEQAFISKLRSTRSVKQSTPEAIFNADIEPFESEDSNVSWVTTAADYLVEPAIPALKEYTTKKEAPPQPLILSLNAERLIKELEAQGITALWHMTHRNNIPTLREKGILSHSSAYESLQPIDISSRSVQHWRTRVEPVYGRCLHDYAPTYFNIRNPMLFVKKDLNKELCLIEISLSVLKESQFIFTDGNAAAKNTQFFNSTIALNRLPWDVLHAKYWNDFIDGKRKRCAEMLIYPFIKPAFFIKIHCYSDETLGYLQSVGCNAEKSERLFY